MPQIFQVLKCYKCSVFQVHQTKKSNKFACKMCGEKQSIKRHYGVGSGQECREHVQKLNGIRGELMEAKESTKELSESDEEYCPSTTNEEEGEQKQATRSSKWVEYVNNEENMHPSEPQDAEMFLEDKEVVLELPKRKRQRKSFNTIKKNSKKDDGNETNDIEHNYLNEKDFQDIQNTVSRNSFKKKLPDSITIYDLDKSISGNRHSFNINSNINQGNIHKQKSKKPFVPPLANQNSKWVKFEHNSPNDCLSDNVLLLKESNINHIDKCSKTINNQINYEDNSSIIQKQDNNKESLNKFVCKNSKWADFIEESDNDNITSQDNESQVDSELSSQKNLQALFSLCDDKEIDEFLDI